MTGNVSKLYLVERYYDGDTLTCITDLDGCSLQRWRWRLAGIDAPEIGAKAQSAWEQQQAVKARDAITAWIAKHLPGGVTVERAKFDNYGRPLGVFTAAAVPALDDERTLARWLVMQQLAVPHDGRSSTPHWRDIYPDPNGATHV